MRSEFPDKGTEYTGEVGPTGIPLYRPLNALTPSDKARLLRDVGFLDPAAEFNRRVWHGEDVEKTVRQRMAEETDEL